MARPRRYIQMVGAARDEACLAVRLFNDPAEVRSFEGFVVHMHLAWLYLLHAEFDRDGIDVRYWSRSGKTRRLDKVDGEARRWELSRCTRERWPNNCPVRANLEFFIALRNKIEHRYTKKQDALMAAVGGEVHALLLNFEEELVSQFGSSHSLATRIQFPVFIGSFTNEGELALRMLRKSLPANLRSFIAQYQAQLTPEITNDPRFELRLKVFPEAANRPSSETLPLQFVHLSKLTDEERKTIEALGNRGVVVTKDRRWDVIGSDHLRPTVAAAQVAEAIPFKFNVALFSKAWKKLQIRPGTDSNEPWATKTEYCTYDARHGDYGYKPAFVKLLIKHCSTEDGFRQLLETAPRDRETGEWIGEPPANAYNPYARRLAK